MTRIAVTAREVLRHMLFKSGTYNVLTWLREKRGGTSAHLEGTNAKLRFQEIYETGVWRHGDSLTPRFGFRFVAIGDGYAKEPPSLLDELRVKTLLDVGCGDFF